VTTERIEEQRITEVWLREVGFKWHLFDRQPDKHWALSLGWAIGDQHVDSEDLIVELAPLLGRDSDGWHCWLRADYAGRYTRFLHIRHLRFQHELIAMIEGLTGATWDPANNMYGMMLTPQRAHRNREERKRADLRLRHSETWDPAVKDDSRGPARPEHRQGYEDMIAKGCEP